MLSLTYYFSAPAKIEATPDPPFAPIKFFITGTNLPIIPGDIPSDWKDPAERQIPRYS